MTHALGIDWTTVEAGTVFQPRAVSRKTSRDVAATLDARGLELVALDTGRMRVMAKADLFAEFEPATRARDDERAELARERALERSYLEHAAGSQEYFRSLGSAEERREREGPRPASPLENRQRLNALIDRFQATSHKPAEHRRAALEAVALLDAHPVMHDQIPYDVADLMREAAGEGPQGGLAFDDTLTGSLGTAAGTTRALGRLADRVAGRRPWQQPAAPAPAPRVSSFAIGSPQLGLPLRGTQAELGELLERTRAPVASFDPAAAEEETQRQLAAAGRKIQTKTFAEHALRNAQRLMRQITREPGALAAGLDGEVSEAVRDYWTHRGSLLAEPWQGADNSAANIARDLRAVREGHAEEKRERETEAASARAVKEAIAKRQADERERERITGVSVRPELAALEREARELRQILSGEAPEKSMAATPAGRAAKRELAEHKRGAKPAIVIVERSDHFEAYRVEPSGLELWAGNFASPKGAPAPIAKAIRAHIKAGGKPGGFHRSTIKEATYSVTDGAETWKAQAGELGRANADDPAVLRFLATGKVGDAFDTGHSLRLERVS